jgi:sarcosine oxidase, subunit gamma
MRSRATGSCSIIRVQTWDSQARAPAAIEDLLGIVWPREIGAVAGGVADVICVGPTDWLVLAGDPDATAWLNRLGAAFQGSTFRATNVSQALVRIQVEALEVRDLLAKGCALDLHQPMFPPGRSARTRFAGMPVIICCTGTFRFELLVTVSYTDYLLSWLADAELEFSGTTA